MPVPVLNPQSYGFTWSNPSTKIQCKLDYFLVSKHLNHLINESRILPNIHSDHSAVSLSLSFHETSPHRGPGFWKFNNSLLSDNYYVEKLSFLIPQAARKYQDVKDKGLFWEMIKMEIRTFTIKYSKQKAKATHNGEKRLWLRLEQLQESLDKKYSDTDKDEMNKINGLTVEFYGYFWNIIAKYMVESFNYAFESRNVFPKNKE